MINISIIKYNKNIPSVYVNIGSIMLNSGKNKEAIINFDKAINFKNIKIESLEGFVRQIISWREYVRLLYKMEHAQFNKMNFLKHTNF